MNDHYLVMRRFAGRYHASVLLLLFLCALVPATVACAQAASPADALESDVTQGALRVETKGGVVECPLRHTDVKASISGFIARVTVTQTFYNPFDDKIEAVYVFPLPHTAAVDDMTMVIGERKIVGVIKRRAEARAIYEQALSQGLTASLLEQERPNIFTQSVGNIKPKGEVKIVISYVDVLKYDMGTYEFHFPMVVGPRYNANAPFAGAPAGAANKAETPAGAMPAEGVNPPVLKPGFRTGHDVSLSVKLDAGVPVHEMKVTTHQVSMTRQGDNQASVQLSPADAIPNKDFVLKYSVIGEKPEMAVLTHCIDSSEGYFMLMLQPRIDAELAKAPPREVVFLIDVSGSMSGEPTQKNIEIMREFFQRSKPTDTFQVITFANETNKLFDKAVPATEENIKKALNFTNAIAGGGGTEMLKGINMVLDEPTDPKRVRIVVMLTDGYIGNEAQIIEAVGKKAGDKIRFWTVGIGSSPNRFLLDGVAKQGGGMSAVVDLKTDPKEVVGNIVERIHRAQLADIKIDWGSLPVYDIYPRKIPELWAGRPVILFGRYNYGSQGHVTLSGTAEGNPVSYGIDVTLPDDFSAEHDVLAKVWARNKIEDLMAQMYYGDSPEVIEEVTQVALKYRLMSQYTSFVAVDASEAKNLHETAKPPRRVGIPVPLPEGVSFDGIFGNALEGWAGDALAKDEATSMDYSALQTGSTLGRTRHLPSYATKAKSAIGRAAASAAAAMPPSPSTTYTYGSFVAGSPPLATTALPSAAPSMVVSKFDVGKTGLVGSISSSPRGAITGEKMLDLDAEYLPAASGLAQETTFSTNKRFEEAQKALDAATSLQKKGDLDAAFVRAQQAYLLGSITPYNGDFLARIEALMQSLSDDILQSRSKQTPALAKTLDLVLRNQSVPSALQAIAKASGLKIDLLDGSLADAGGLLGQEPRVNYLDLRGATVADGLEWLLTPLHLSWRVEDGTVVVGSARRLTGLSTWVYKVGDLAQPVESELTGKDANVEIAKSLLVFLHIVHLAIGQHDDGGLDPGSAVYLTADRLLVYGDVETHAKVEALLTYLSTARVDWAKRYNGLLLSDVAGAEVDAVRQVTLARCIKRAPLQQKQAESMAQYRLLSMITSDSWQLFAAETGKQTDDQALTELRIAWADPRMKAILDGKNAWIAARSAWILTDAAYALPGNAELQTLAVNASGMVLRNMKQTATALNGKPDPAAYLNGLYTALTLKNLGKSPIDKELPALPEGMGAALIKQEANSSLAAARVLAASLFAPTNDSDVLLKKLITKGDHLDEDFLVLMTYASRVRGGGMWRTFSEQLPDILQRGQVDGSVMIGVNHLIGAPPVRRAGK